MKTFLRFFLVAGLAGYLSAASGQDSNLWKPAITAAKPIKVADGVVYPIGGSFLKVEIWGDNVVRIAAATNRTFLDRVTPATEVRVKKKTAFKSVAQGTTGTITTDQLKVGVNLLTGAVTFSDTKGNVILAESGGGREMLPALVQGENTAHVRQQWEEQADESLYGLGQRQIGALDIKGFDLDLWQHNTHVVLPFLVSSRGYGILWDNLSYSRFGDLRGFEAIPAEDLRDASGQAGGLTAGSFSATNADQLQNSRVTAEITAAGGRGRGADWIRYAGEVVAPTTGDYQFRTYSNGGIKVWLDGKLVIDHWRQNWLTDHDQVKVRLEAGKHYAIRVEHGGDQATTLQLSWKTPSPSAATSLWSEVGDAVDYYFVYGPALDDVIAGYRQLTGQATMLPQWAFGLWQSRQRYETAEQSLDVVKEYRRRGLPFDNIVQDWQYWKPAEWGSHQFDPARFPDPDGWIKALHQLHTHLMISVWGKFYPGTPNFEAMKKAGYLYLPDLDEGVQDWINYPYTFYDAFNADARKLYWSQINSNLFAKGIDAWWMDATEPDLTASPPTLEGQRKYMMPTAGGTASRVLNGYALENSKAVYTGQREVAPNQRVFILTRSGFAGIQRYGTVTWSGDITCTWTAMGKQIPAGLGFCVSGDPYWTMDCGGYTMHNKFSARNPKPEDAEEWRELNARWFEFATFCPILRLHGELQPREPWAFGGDNHPAYKAITKFDELRYRMLPYNYSLAANAAKNAGTMMRPLVMDFPQDKTAREIPDEYLWGPAFLVSPVTTYLARERAVYLPATTGGWYDFWTGQAQAGGQNISAPAPYDALPVYVRAGSVVPFGPALQYTSEKPADKITLYVYAGANSSFTLYEDDGTTYGCERGQFARIPMQWDDAKSTLTIGRREGKFPGMLTQRTFNVVLVRATVAKGFAFEPTPDASVAYRGAAVKLPIPPR